MEFDWPVELGKGASCVRLPLARAGGWHRTFTPISLRRNRRRSESSDAAGDMRLLAISIWNQPTWAEKARREHYCCTFWACEFRLLDYNIKDITSSLEIKRRRAKWHGTQAGSRPRYKAMPQPTGSTMYTRERFPVLLSHIHDGIIN